MKNKEELRSIASQIYTISKKEKSKQAKREIADIMKSLSMSERLEVKDILHKYLNQI